MSKPYQAVIFDLDGTLLNTLDDLHAAVNHTMSALNHPLRTKDEVRSFVGDGIKELIKRSLPEGNTSDMVPAYDIFCRYYSEHNAQKTLPYAGMVPLVQRLRQSGVQTAVVTNKTDFAANALCDKFFPDCFHTVIGARDNLAKKPSPDGVHQALTQMNVQRAHAVYVGDSDVDFQTAKNAGLDCILVSWGFRDKALLEKLQPLAVADDAKSLQNLLLGEE